ncbi:hypothetical protein MHYP_G00151460 [Metynnis hypsauchen]
MLPKPSPQHVTTNTSSVPVFKHGETPLRQLFPAEKQEKHNPETQQGFLKGSLDVTTVPSFLPEQSQIFM